MKIAKRLVVFSAAFLLLSCGSDSGFSSAAPSSEEGTSAESSVPAEFVEGSSVLFSEFYLGSSVMTRAVEISNYGTSSVSLSDYSLRIFHGSQTTYQYNIPLGEGTLAPGASFVVAYSGNTEHVDADLYSADFVDNGVWPIGLYKGETRVDTLGHIGYEVAFCSEEVVYRKNERRIGREYSLRYDWIGVPQGTTSNLGNSVCPISMARLAEGPKLTEEAFSLPYADSETKLGAGGVVETTVAYYGDGDTTTFNVPSYFHDDYGTGKNSFRYQNIDTPETQHGNTINAQPWGYAAATWNNNVLKAAKHILIQAVKGAYLTETYGRLLGYVWYSDLEDPKPEDYKNLNFETIYNGYSRVAFSDAVSSTLLSDGVSFYSYFCDANERAEELGIKIHGEKDPDFDYD